MSFDELFQPPPAEALERPESTHPSWWPPDDELGVPVPDGRVLARSELAVVALPHMVAYSAGLQLELFAHTRSLRPDEANRLHHAQHLFEPGAAAAARANPLW